MSRGDRRTMRHEAQGVRWSVEPHGAELRIAIVFDDEPDETIERTVSCESRAAAARTLEALVAEQCAEGFVELPRWSPTLEWIASADDRELGLEVIDPWVIAIGDRPERFASLPTAVRAFLALRELATQSGRNGLAAFVVESDPRLVAHVPEAARELGLPEVEAMFTEATRGIDFERVHGTLPSKLRWASRARAKKLEAYASLELDELLLRFLRAHAEDFVPLP